MRQEVARLVSSRSLHRSIRRRRSWCWRQEEEETTTFSLQLIFGKTLTANIGDEEAGKLFKAIRTGSMVRVGGVLKQQAGRVERARDSTIDFIVHNVTLLQPSLSDIEDIEAHPKRESNHSLQLQQMRLRDIVIVDEPQALTAALNTLEQSIWDGVRNGYPSTIGIDAEWPSADYLVEDQQAVVSILQLSSGDFAVLLDLKSWFQRWGEEEEEEATRTLEEILGPFLLREDILKLGFSFEMDMKMLLSSFPRLLFLQQLQRLVDDHHAFVDIKHMVMASGRLSRQNFGLSAACKSLLGHPLSKEMQVSNWNLRPLADEQIRYAATDAQCLVLLYRVLGPEIAERARRLWLSSKKSGKGKQKKRERRREEEQEGGMSVAGLIGRGDGHKRGERRERNRGVCNLVEFDEKNLLGRRLAGEGKSVVIRELAGPEADVNFLCSERHSSGCLEWPNALVLLINIGHGRYNNDFSADGETVSWYASIKFCSSSPILRKTILEWERQMKAEGGEDGWHEHAAGGGEEQEAEEGGGEEPAGEQGEEGGGEEDANDIPPTLLFARFKNQPYVFLGRLRIQELHVPSSQTRPVKVTWRLEDAAKLREVPDFMRIIGGR
mmetsp:Transcript_9442/g.31568  ORF Transcript_9442/g.31568 Transcript_9442/m.31568 type:complete len:608 (-) Transcript_9442:178-2001(-)